MKQYHEQIIKLEGQQRKLNQQIADKKKSLARKGRQNRTLVDHASPKKDQKEEADL